MILASVVVLLAQAAPAVSPVAVAGAVAGAPSSADAAPVVSVERVSGAAEVADTGSTWGSLMPGTRLEAGRSVRTGAAGRLALESATARMTLGPSARLTLSEPLALGAGRLEVSGAAQIGIGEAVVSGRGRFVLRALDGTLAVSVIEGEAKAGLDAIALSAGEGALLSEDGTVVGPLPLPTSPEHPSPGADPVYVRQGQPVALSWSGVATARYRLGLFRLSGLSLREWETTGTTTSLELTDPGHYRWQVATADPRGLESRSGVEGFFCVVER